MSRGRQTSYSARTFLLGRDTSQCWYFQNVYAKAWLSSTILLKGWGLLHTYTLCIGEGEAGGSRVQRQPELYNKTLSQRERGGDGHLRRWLGPEGGILTNNINAFIYQCLYGKDPWSSYHMRTQQEDTEEQTFDKCRVCQNFDLGVSSLYKWDR